MAMSYYVNEYWDSIANPTLNWIFPGGPWLLLMMIAGYLLIVLRIGPDYMKDREPYQLKPLIKYYNIINISSNAFVFIITLYWTRFTIDCWKCDHTLTPTEVTLGGLLSLGLLLMKVSNQTSLTDFLPLLDLFLNLGTNVFLTCLSCSTFSTHSSSYCVRRTIKYQLFMCFITLGCPSRSGAGLNFIHTYPRWYCHVSTVSYTLWCTLTITWQLIHTISHTYGGNDIWQKCNWYNSESSYSWPFVSHSSPNVIEH